MERESTRWKTVDVPYEKKQRKKRRKTESRQVEHEDHVVKVNDKLNANATESKRTLGSFPANKFEATRE